MSPSETPTTFQWEFELAPSERRLIARQECARILALNVAHYANRYGELPIEARLDFLHASELSEKQAKHVARGMETFVGVLGNVLGHEEPKH